MMLGSNAQVWDPNDADLPAVELGHVRDTQFAIWSPDSTRLVTVASHVNTATVWDAESGKELLTLAGHSRFIESAQFSPDGSRIVTSSRDNTAKVWTAARARFM